MASEAKLVSTTDSNDLAIGYLRPDGSVHIGQDFWVSGEIHNTLSQSKDPIVFVETLVVAKFEGDLKTTSTCGQARGSTDYQRIKQLRHLDQHKGYYRYWLENIYEPRLKLQKVQLYKYDRAVQICSFKKYVKIAIANLYGSFMNSITYDDDID